MNVVSACLPIYVLSVHLVPSEVRGGYYIHWNCGTTMWVLRTDLGSSIRVVSVLNH